MSFGEKLSNLRKKEGISQEELAEKLNITRQTISNWELGQSSPDMNKLLEISKIFNISVDELTSDSEKDNNTNSSSITAKQKGTRKWLLYLLIVILIGSIITLVIRIGLEKEKENNESKGLFNNIVSIFNNTLSNEAFDNIKEDGNKNMFNNSFTYSAGTQSGFFLSSTLDKVISSNAQNPDHIITVTFNGASVSSQAEITTIKNQLKSNKNYEVTVNYDNNGYVNDISFIKGKASESEISMFNIHFTYASGTNPSNFVSSTLDQVITSNAQNPEQLITVVYNDITTTDADQIRNIKKSFGTWDDYEVSIEYDEDGFVNKVIIENI